MSLLSAVEAAYVVAALLFILSLAGLSRHETAKAGNTFGMAGMAELIAILHSFVGLAAVLVGWNGYLSVEAGGGGQTEVPADLLGIHSAEVVIGVFIGAVTLTGSIVAFLKLSARIKSNPLMLPGRNWLNLGALVAFLALTVLFVIEPNIVLLSVVTALALALGW